MSKDTSEEPSVAEVYGRVVQIFGSEGISDVDVCLYDRCTTTDSAGNYRLYDIPKNAEHTIFLSADSLVAGAIPFTIADDSLEIPNVSL